MKAALRLLSLLFCCTFASLHAAPVSLVNPSFEQPGTGRIATGFDATADVPGWANTGGAYLNSGVELALQPLAAGGYVNASGYVAFLRGTDGGAYQATTQQMEAGQVYRLTWKAGSLASLAGTANQQVRLFRTTDGGVTRTPLATSNDLLSATNQVFETYLLEYTATAADAGARIGIEIDNLATTSGTIGFDDFQLELNPSGPAPATGLPSLAWDNGAADDGTVTFTSTTPIEREYHFRVQPQASLYGGWRTVVRVAEGNANVYLRQAGWANTTTFNFKSDRATGDDGFVLRPDQFSAGQTWYLTVRAVANTSFTLFSGDVFVQDLGGLAFTDANANGQYDIGETIQPSGSGAVSVKGEGMRFFKTTVFTGTPAWSLWLNGDMRDIAVKKASVPYHALPAQYGRKQAGQMLVSPPFLGVGTDTYFISVVGMPGDPINLDSRIQQIEDMPFHNTVSNVAVSGPPYRVYRTNVPVDQIAWDVSVSANEGDPNVCVRRANVASEYDNDGYSEANGAVSDSVTLVPDFLTNGTWFVTVYGVGNYNFTLKSGDPLVTPIEFTDHKVNDQTTRAGWRYYALTNIPQQLGPLGWELYLSQHVPGTQISLRRNKVPSRWQYRSGGVNTVLDTNAKYSDYASTTGFLQRPGHQADVWYVGVFTPQQPLGTFELDVRPIQPPTVGFDGSQTAAAGLKAGEWRFVKVTVPATAGILGWDLRVKNVSGAGDPKLVICRDLLPSSLLTSFATAPSGTPSWPSGAIWAGQVDWTKRANESGGTPNVSGRRLVMAMGRPLQPGTYYAGVFNNGTLDLSAYILESRGIGTGQTLPVTPLALEAGSSSTITNLAPREAKYYKVTVPENTPSWEFTVDLTLGEMMATVRRGHIPDFGAPAAVAEADIQTSLEDAERSATVQKNGPERFVLLPPPYMDELIADDYYVAVVSEGQDPLTKQETGSGNASGVITSRGNLAVTHMGVASVSGITESVSLVGNQVKAFQYEVPEDTLSLEIYLEDRTGNPWSNVSLRNLLPMPPPNYTATALSYNGFSGGHLDPGDQGGVMWNVSNPLPGLNSITVRACPTPSDTANFPDATAQLRVVAVVPEPLEFDGGQSTIGSQQPGTWRYFKVEVPDTPGVMGWDVRLRDVTGGGKPWVQICRDYVPAGTETSSWQPYASSSWLPGFQIAATADWTSRSYDGPTSTTSVDTYRIITGMGRPLEPGTYYVGVFNYSTIEPTNYTLESSGIGEGQTIPIHELPYAGGAPSEIVDLNPRDAVYYKVTIPENTSSWEFSLNATAGEMMAVIRRGTIPDFGAPNSSQTAEQIQVNSGTREVEVQKTGSERYVMLPPSGASSLVAGDYYIAAISEGSEPATAQRTGATPSSGIMTAVGFVPATDMGVASSAGVTRPVSLAGGQVKLYRVTVPAGTESMEVRLTNRTGNPWISMVPGFLPPRPSLFYTASSSTGYGVSGGQTGPTIPYFENDDLMTVANPTPGDYTIAVRAACGATGSQLIFPDATGDLTVIANKPLPLAFNGGTSEVVGQAAGAWKYFEVVVPPTAGVMGWDIRVKNVSGAGSPKLFVRRDQLPSGAVNLGWTGKPSQAATWPTGSQWVAQTDWTRRIYDAGVNTDVSFRRLVMGMGRPLEPGTYIVGIQNTSGTAAANYTVESRGIGTGMVLPVTDLAFASGSASIPNLVAREAAYFKVSIPANTPSWEFTLDPSVGEMMAVVRRGAIPDFGGEFPYSSDGFLQNVQPSGHREAVVQKNGPERFTVLPISGQDYLLEGDYYIAAISEGQNPASVQYTGTATSTGQLTSRGVLAITDLGTIPSPGVTRAVILAGGQLKAYQFTVPPDLAGVEIRLDERIGNPWFSVIQGSRLPKPSEFFQGTTPNEYGFTDGQGGSGYFHDDSSITLVAPEPGVYSLIVRASANPASHTTAALDASANLVIRPKPRIPLNFASSLNAAGGTNTDTRQITDGERTFYEVAVPNTLDGQPVIGWILRTGFQQGAGSIKVYKTWGNSSAGISVTTRTAVIVPPFLTPGDTWFVEVTGSGLTNYTITSEPVTLNQPPYAMPAGHNNVFGDSGANLTGDRGIDLGQDDWHFYAVDVPAGNAGLLRTELQAINGNPNLYIREDGVPTTDHNATGVSGATLTPRVLNSTGSEYGNWVPLDGRKEVQLRPGRWYLGVKATGTSNARYRLVVSNGQVNDLQLSGGSAAGQLLVGRDWRYYRVQMPMDAPVDWTPSFLQQVGDVVMFIRDTVPPGNAANGQETSGMRSWQSDGKNQGPYSPAAGHDAPGSYPFTTPPLRPGNTYYIGLRAVTDATFTVSSACSATTIGTFPAINFYNGTLNVSVPASSELLYQIPVPAEATRMKWTSTHLSALQLRLEQGTLPGSTGTAQHFRSSSANSSINFALTPTTWPWVAGHTYFLRLVNTGTTSLNLALTMNGKNALTEDEDTDGLPDAWEVLHFGNITLRNGTADPDGDGVNNVVEYADGTIPTDINSALYFVNITTTGGGAVNRSADLPKYPRGHALTLTPVPDAGLSFVGWTGNLTGTTNPVALTVTSNLTANASFGIPLPVALDAPSLAWAIGGHGLWYGQSTVKQDGVDAGQSGAIGHSQESWMETTVYGPGTLDFRWKVSCQANADFLEFHIDGVLQTGRISGEVDWAQKSYTLTSGPHTLRWRYFKNSSTVGGADTGWVDTISWSGTNPYANWIASKFTPEQQANLQISGPDADPDGDGLTNLLEFAFNLPPMTAGLPVLAPGSGTSGLPSVSATGTGPDRKLRMEYIRRKGVFTYSPEVSSSMSGADWVTATGTPVVTSIDSEWERVVVEDTAGSGAAKRFGRVKVEASP